MTKCRCLSGFKYFTAMFLKICFIYAWLVLLFSRAMRLVVLGERVNVHVTLISIHIGLNSAAGYTIAQPVYEIATRDSRMRYPNSLSKAKLMSIYLPGYDLCQDGRAYTANFFAEFYYSHPEVFDRKYSFPVVFTSDCSDEVLELAELARELDLPLFSSRAGDAKLMNRQTFPTTSALVSVSRTNIHATMEELLRRFSWHVVAVLCDSLTQFPGISFYEGQCSEILVMLRNNFYFESNEILFDSAKEKSFRDKLIRVKDKSRVIIVLTSPDFVRELMIEADKLEMTAGDYVFITVQPLRRPGVPIMHWNQDGDTPDNNSRALTAFKTLIVLTGLDPQWELIRNLTTEFSETAMRLHNHKDPSGGEENEILICVYESAMMFAQVFDENYPEAISMNAQQFITKFFNRTFNFAGRDFSTDTTGSKVDPVIIYRLDLNTQTMEKAMVFDTVGKIFVEVNETLWYWINQEGNKPPVDIPPCGFHNEECHVHESFTPVAVSVPVLLIIFIVTGVIYRRYRKSKEPLWWLVNSEIVSEASESSSVPKKYLDKLTDQLIGIRCHLADKDAYAFKMTSASRRRGDVGHVLKNIKLLKLFQELRQHQHPNLARFYGMAFSGESIFLFSEEGQKKTLRHLLDQQNLVSDDTFQFAICWNFIEGLEYLHHYGPHGNLNTMICIIDAKFTLKISQVGYSEIADLYFGQENCKETGFTKDELVFKPPDVLTVQREFVLLRQLSLTKECDMYSTGVILYEMFTRYVSYDPVFDSGDAKGKMTFDPTDYRHAFETGLSLEPSLPDRLKLLLKSCFRTPDERPSAKSFRLQLRAIRPKPKNIVEYVVQRLQHQAHELEKGVAERTKLLQTEMQKADRLLSEILPPEIAKRLRNKEVVTPESFQCVTVMFSDLPEFGNISSLCTPLQIIAFLNSVYSVFDGVIPGYDAYKVETINDSYVVASGLPRRNADQHVFEICDLAIALLSVSKSILDPTTANEAVQLRIGISTGPIISSVIGVRMPRYCLVGDTMNTASRMESSGQGGKIHISLGTKALVDYYPDSNANYRLEPRGGITVKGKGLMHTFWLSNVHDPVIPDHLLEAGNL